ncbi:hypothetical protein [Portibacter marinus]|uniref:hypothetical protein n=1 Tax=Portibacter marinus TaxID=2898660 RepID=UPI001F336B42|nr:hypothetical protein [Portibacter marinus]
MFLFSEALKDQVKYVLLLTFLFGVAFTAFVPDQEDFSFILAGFSVSFASYIILIHKSYFKLNALLYCAVIIRVILLFAFPNLSDDIYRFIWDGNLLHEGINPYEYLPSEYIESTNVELFRNTFPLLNSPDYYSIYPTFAQIIFYISSFSWMDTSFVIKLILIAAECLTIYTGIKVLDLLKMDQRNILWYALNPLVIVEVMGNLHFEGFVACFFMIALYYYLVQKLNASSFFLALSISVKLVPLLFLPYFLFQMKWPKALFYLMKVGLITLILLSPLILQLSGFTESLDLYFRKFEFNASIYFVLREIGQLWKGYNMIAQIGPWLGVCTFVVIMLLAYKVKDFILFCQLALLAFLLLSTTVHPWYLTLGVLLSVFSHLRFFILWSFLIILSYSKYGMGNQAYYTFIGIEYLILTAYLIYEISKRRTRTFNLE